MPEAAAPTVAPPAALPRRAGWRDRVRAARARRRGAVTGSGVVLGRGLTFDLAPGARVELGDGAALGDGCRFHVAAGAVVLVGAGAVLGERCAVAAHARVEIGDHAQLADEVVLVDATPRSDDVERPVREQGLRVAPVVVGAGARVGPGAVIGAGVAIGAGAQVGAHAVVERDVPAGAVADGVPAHAGASAGASRARLRHSADDARDR